MHEMLIIAFDDNNIGQTQTFNWFFLIQKWESFE